MKPAVRAGILAAIAAIATLHILYLGDWIVEDAAISWAYARNLAAGLGPVPWAGAEPVEGYSNPTWVLLLTVGELLGLHAFWTTRLLATTLTAATVVLVHELTARAQPRPSEAIPLAAAALFALNTQVGIFGAAGLENPLFNLLLGAAVLRMLHEQHQRSAPWSAALFCALALTRPEGLAYGLVAGALTTLARFRRGRSAVEISRWWLAILAPLLAYHLARWSYFSWELPATAYAKIAPGYDHLLDWNGPGWRYLRDYAQDTGQGYFLPLYVLAMTGIRGRGLPLAAAILGPGLFLYAVSGDPELDLIRCLFPLAAGVGLWLASLRDEIGSPRALLCSMGMIALFFALYARGDWMSGTRWMTMAAVPGSVLLALGLSELAIALGGASRPATAPLLAIGFVGLFAVPQLAHTAHFVERPAVSPWDVRARVRKADFLARRMGIDERPRLLTVDMGGFLMWSDFRLNDIMGLTDMPIAQSRRRSWLRPFVHEYIVQESHPDIVMMGPPLGMFKLWPEFDEAYPLAMFGWRIRRDRVFSAEWTGTPGRRVPYDGTVLTGWEIPEPRVAAGSRFSLEVGLQNSDQRRLRVWAFLVDAADAVAGAWDLDLLVPDTLDWPTDAIYHGRYTLDLPRDLPEGPYRIGFTLRTFDATNAPLPEFVAPPGARIARTAETALFRPGEILFAEGIELVSAEVALEEAQTDRQRALDQLAAGSCEQGEGTWRDAREHGVVDFDEQWTDEMATRAASCWLLRASERPGDAVAALERARDLDPELAGLDDACRSVADTLVDRGHDARQRTDLDGAYAALRDALRVDPYRTWVRHEVEDLRVLRMERAKSP